MFDFEKLDLYQIVKEQNQAILRFILDGSINDAFLSEKLKNATISVQLFLAEGSGRFGSKDKKQCIMSSRSSVFECVALLDVIKDLGMIGPDQYKEFYDRYETISKMLLGMYRNIQD